jgi:hypothetical protein
MPEYLAPGVYVEEVSFRAKSIEGVSTSVTGFVGPTRYGPVGGEPELLTSFADFSRIYGGLDSLEFEGDTEPYLNYTAHAVRAFFDNGGSKLYVTRVYDSADPSDIDEGKAVLTVASPTDVVLRARFPGRAGNMRITFALRASANVLVIDPNGNPIVRGVRPNSVVFIKAGTGSPSLEGFYDVIEQGTALAFDRTGSPAVQLSQLASGFRVHVVTLVVRV